MPTKMTGWHFLFLNNHILSNEILIKMSICHIIKFGMFLDTKSSI